MSKADAVAAVGRLVAAFRQEKVRDETIEVYADHLSDVRPEVLTEAVRRVIETCKFMPTVAEIRTAAKEAAAELPGPAPSWLLGPGPDDHPIPMCGYCGKRHGYLEKDGKPICLFCQCSPVTGDVDDLLSASQQRSILPRGDSYEPEDTPPPAEVS